MSQKKPCDVVYPGVLFSPEHLSPPPESSHILSFTNNTFKRTVKWKAHTVMEDCRGHACVFAFLSRILKRYRMWEVLWQVSWGLGNMKESLHQPYFCRTSKGGQERICLGAVRLEIHHLLLFVSIVFQVHCSGDLMLCWELTGVVSTTACQNFTKLPPGFFSFHLRLCTFIWNGRWWLRNQQIRDLYLLGLTYIFYPQEVGGEKIHTFIYINQSF